MSQSSNPAERAELPKQFLVSREQLSPIPGWRRIKLGDYYLYLSAGVGATRINESRNGTHRETIVIGWFSYGEGFYDGTGLSELSIDGDVEGIYPEMTGRFVVLSRDNDRLLCTTDAGAQFPVVYRAETGELGSTPLTLGWTQELRKAPRLSGEFTRADGTLWFPFGITPYEGIERLLPQQTVALHNNRACLADRRRLNPTILGVPGMHQIAQNFIESLASSQGTIDCHLTAGWDSRMVLSASLPLSNNINYLTYLAEGNTACIDAEVASHIAKKFGLHYQQLPVRNPTPDDLKQWVTRTSDCIFDSVANLTRTVVESYADRYGLSGVGGEVGRAFYWKKRDIGATGLSVEELLQRLGFEKSRLALQRADFWLENYRHQSRCNILDRAYIDIRLGCWAGPSLGGHLVEKPTLSPFNSLTVYESMLALPESKRFSSAFSRDFISQGSPQLARIPVNRHRGLRRLHNLHREAARRLPKSAKTRIRRYLTSIAPA